MITDFLTLDPPVAALLLTAFSVVVLALSRFAWRRWRAHEEQKADARARHRERTIQSAIAMSTPDWPTKPGPKGGDWRNRRAS